LPQSNCAQTTQRAKQSARFFASWLLSFVIVFQLWQI
jgi:hypothetical protein